MKIRLAIFIDISLILSILSAIGVVWFQYDNEYYGSLSISEYPQGIFSSVQWALAVIFLLLPFVGRLRSSSRLLSPISLLLVGISFASTTWSLNPLLTLSISLKFVSLFASIAVAVRFGGPDRVLRRIWYVSSLVLVVSFLLALGGSPYALMKGGHDGLWRGVFNHKNTFGPFLTSYLIFSLYLFKRSLLRPSVWALLSAVAIFCLVRAGSASSIVALLFSLILGVLVILPRLFSGHRAPLYIAIFCFSLAAVVFSANVADYLSEFLGRDLTLTGRTSLWDAALPISFSRPFGFGYGTAGGAFVLDAIRANSGWAGANSVHNAYITMALGFGWAATIIYIGWLLRLIVLTDDRAGRWLAVSIASMAALQGVSAMTESSAGFMPNFQLAILLVLVASYRVQLINRSALASGTGRWLSNAT